MGPITSRLFNKLFSIQILQLLDSRRLFSADNMSDLLKGTE